MNISRKNVSRDKWEHEQKINIENAFNCLNQFDSTYKNLSKYQEKDQPQSKIYLIL